MTILRMFMVLRILVTSESVGAIVYVFYSDRSVRFSLLLISPFSVRLPLMRIVLLNSEEKKLLMTHSFLFNSLKFLLHNDKILGMV